MPNHERGVKIIAMWDDMASVWVATSKDVPGMATSAPSIPELKEKLALSLPEFMTLNHPSMKPKTQVSFSVLMRGQTDIVAQT